MATKEVVKFLKDSREVLEPKGAFTKGACARKGNNDMCDVFDDKACKFCAFGAMKKAPEPGTKVKTRGQEYIKRTLLTTYDAAEHFSIADVNDRPGTKQLHVLMAFDFAILMAQDDYKAAKKAGKVS